MNQKEADSHPMQKLKEYLRSLGPGPISDMSQLPDLLADCWDELDGGNAEGMESYKLSGRMEDVSWEPPLLSFIIERHGGFVLGSTRAERHKWGIDVEAKSANCVTVGHKQLRPMQPKWDPGPVVQEIVPLIANHQEDARLKWNEDGSVRVVIGKILPEGSAVKQTLASRRKRFRNLLDQELTARGWRKVRQNVYAPPAT